MAAKLTVAFQHFLESRFLPGDLVGRSKLAYFCHDPMKNFLL